MNYIFSLLLLLTPSLSLASESYEVGQRDFKFKDDSRRRELSTHVWYPTTVKSKLPTNKGGPFLPVVASLNAPIVKQPTKFPIVLISHGSGGKADKLFWLTDFLVRHGAVVIATDHRGNMTGENSADGMMRVWERPKDLSFALNRILEQREFKNSLDVSKVAAAGHSAGGTTVLLLGGARLSATRFTSPIPLCEGSKDPYFAKACSEVKTLDFKNYTKELIEGDYSDGRVKAVVGLDPGMAKSFEPSTLKNPKAKMFVFIADKLNAPQDQIYSRDFVELLAPQPTEIVPNSYHMTFLQACKPDFPKDDPELKELCLNTEEKIKIQNDVAKETLGFFHTVWK